jgi:hypothetical protein
MALLVGVFVNMYNNCAYNKSDAVSARAKPCENTAFIFADYRAVFTGIEIVLSLMT